MMKCIKSIALSSIDCIPHNYPDMMLIFVLTTKLITTHRQRKPDMKDRTQKNFPMSFRTASIVYSYNLSRLKQITFTDLLSDEMRVDASNKPL